MRRAVVAIVALILPTALLAASSNIADLPAGHYRLDARHASLIGRVLHLGVSYSTVRFDRLAADFTYDPARPEATRLQASVDTTSLDAGAGDGSQFADQFLNAAKFPKASFVATSMTPAADARTGTMTGDLTLMGVTRPVTFNVSFVGVGHGLPFGTIAGFSASTVIHRSDFGSHSLLSWVGDDVSLQFDGEFERK
ncbi:MAG: YceI family protein [Caulobacteraceae bacterium]